MKAINKFFDSLKSIWAIEELRSRILLTLGFIFIYRLGSFIVLPGIDPHQIELLQNQSSSGMLGLINMFTGGAFNQASIFALGVMPYISASIFMQLAGIIIPQFAKLQKEESGRNKINLYTRYLTIAVAAAQAFAYITGMVRMQYQQAIVIDWSLFLVSSIVILTATTLFTMWMGEKITDKGIGNGVSLLIMVGILSTFPQALVQEFSAKSVQDKTLIFIIEIVMLIAVVVGLVLLSQGVRRIPLNYARKIVGSNAVREIAGGSRNFIPLKVNSAGVMPIIFAQALMFIPSMIAGFVSDPENVDTNSFFFRINDFGSWEYNVIFAFLVIAFTYFYTALTFNPTELADNLKRNNSFIPGIKPGQPTADYIGAIMDRITLPGSIFLAVAGILPGIAKVMGVTQSLAIFYGGTSMLIGVSVIIDTVQQIDSYLLNKHYDGLMKTGRVATRSQVTA